MVESGSAKFRVEVASGVSKLRSTSGVVAVADKVGVAEVVGWAASVCVRAAEKVPTMELATALTSTVGSPVAWPLHEVSITPVRINIMICFLIGIKSFLMPAEFISKRLEALRAIHEHLVSYHETTRRERVAACAIYFDTGVRTKSVTPAGSNSLDSGKPKI